jgi:hypothetical protein
MRGREQLVGEGVALTYCFVGQAGRNQRFPNNAKVEVHSISRGRFNVRAINLLAANAA